MTGSGLGMSDWHVFGSFVGYLALIPGIGLLAGTYLNRKIVAIVAVSLVTEKPPAGSPGHEAVLTETTP